MSALFEAIKLIFFIMTIFLALIITRGAILFGTERNELLTNIITPGYIVLIGILLGYIFALIILSGSKDPLYKNKVMTNMFLVGIVLGIIFALLYIFVL